MVVGWHPDMSASCTDGIDGDPTSSWLESGVWNGFLVLRIGMYLMICLLEMIWVVGNSLEGNYYSLPQSHYRRRRG